MRCSRADAWAKSRTFPADPEHARPWKEDLHGQISTYLLPVIHIVGDYELISTILDTRSLGDVMSARYPCGSLEEPG